MKIYIASRYSRRHECHELAKFLMGIDHQITSRWVKSDSDHVKISGLSEQAADSDRQRFAVEDIEDIENCDCMISLMQEPRNNSRGGRHVEFGYALAFKKTMFIIGPKETVFHHLENVYRFNDVDGLREHFLDGYFQGA